MKKALILSFLLIFIIVMLSGCSTTSNGNGNANNGNTSNSSTGNNSTGSGSSTTLSESDTVSDLDSPDILTVELYNTNETYLPFFAYVKSKVPDITYRFNSFRGANGSQYTTNILAQGKQADVYLTSRIECKEELCKKNLIDLSAYSFLDNISTSVLDSVNVDGGIYLLPIRNTILGIAYNKTLLDEWGFDLPTCYDDLVALKQKCDENGMSLCKQYSKLPGGGFQVLMNIACMCFLNTPEGVQWEKEFLAGNDVDFSIWDGTLDYLQKLQDIGFFECNDTEYPYGANDEKGLFYRGTLLAITQNFFDPVSAKEYSEDEFGMMPLISPDGSRNIYVYTPNSYIGLSNSLLKPENEKKLNWALELMNYYATGLGQQALHYDKAMFSILKNAPMSPDSYLYDAYLAGLDGRMPRQIYTTWNQYNLVIDPGNAFLNWCKGEGELSEITASLKRCRQDALTSGGVPVFTTCKEDLTIEQSARIVGAVYAKMAGTDVALMSIGQTHTGEMKEYTLGDETFSIPGFEVNMSGVNGTLYKGDVTQEDSWVILPGTYGNTDSIALLRLTGKQINDLVQTGFDAYNNGNVFPYVLTVKNGITLQDDVEYTVATSRSNFTEATAQLAKQENIDIPDFLNVFTETLGSLGDLSPDMTLNW